MLLLTAAGACLVATGAQAQASQGQSSQPAPTPARYLTWANRPANTTPADVAAAQARVRDSMIPRRVAPSQSPYRPMVQPTAMSRPDPRGLTPAAAWLGPPVAPTYAPGSPDPIAYATTDMAAPSATPAYAPPSAPAERVAPQPQPVARAAVDPMAPRPDAPIFNVPRPAPAPAQPAAADTTDPTDPMAPRRDARIFQMQQNPDQAAPSAPAPAQTGQSGVRYYSVHRDAGQRPDPTTLPEPVFFDSVAIDLAEPPTHEPPIRDAQGRRRVAAAADPSVP